MSDKREDLGKEFEKVAAGKMLTDRFIYYTFQLNQRAFPSEEKMRKHFAGLFETQARVFYVESGQRAKLSRFPFSVSDMVRRMVKRMSGSNKYAEFLDSYLGKAFQREMPEVDKSDLAGYFADCTAVAAYFHDVGKERTLYSISKSPEFLDRIYKSAKIEPVMLEKLRQHVQAGARMVAVRPISAMVLHHHERSDGAGHPQGLKRDEIPLGSRIIFPCVALHAIVNWRSYDVEHPGWYGMEELKRCSGQDFDQAKMIQHLQEEAYPKAKMTINKRLIGQEMGAAHFRDEEKYFQRRYLVDKPEQARQRFGKEQQFDATVVEVLLEEFGPELKALD